MYTNVPIKQLLKSTNTFMLHNKIDRETSKEITEYCNIILKQNYLQNNENLHVQTDNLAMGVPASSIFSDI